MSQSIEAAFAPGRVELLGNHVDYNEGCVLAGALNLGVSAWGTKRADEGVVLRSEGVAEGVEVREIRPTGTWGDYVLGVARELRDDGWPVGGFEAHFSSTLPIGAGLSSSAAMEVCTAVLLKKLFPFPLEPMAMAKLCRKAENEFVGVNCGLLDQAASVFGREDHAILLDCRKETVTHLPFPAGMAILVIHSGAGHRLTGGEYNERRAQCKEAARLLGVKALRDVTMEELETTEMPEIVRRRARHVVGEMKRVAEAADLLREGDAAGFGKLMVKSHESSRENFENSTPELDQLVELAIAQPGVQGARLTGGGFGGSIVALVRHDAAAEASRKILERYIRITGREGKVCSCRLGAGAA